MVSADFSLTLKRPRFEYWAKTVSNCAHRAPRNGGGGLASKDGRSSSVQGWGMDLGGLAFFHRASKDAQNRFITKNAKTFHRAPRNGGGTDSCHGKMQYTGQKRKSLRTLGVLGLNIFPFSPGGMPNIRNRPYSRNHPEKFD